MIIELGQRKNEVTIDKKNNTISVDGYTLPIISKFGYTYKLYKRPLAVGCEFGADGLQRFFEQQAKLNIYFYLFELCDLVKKYGYLTT